MTRRTAFNAPSPGERGFTLIEVLVGLALTGMAAAMLLSGLHFAGMAALRLRGESGGADQVVSAQRLLRATLTRLKPITDPRAMAPTVRMEGEGTRVRFFAAPLDRDAPDALHQYQLERTSDGRLILFDAGMRRIDVRREGMRVEGWSATLLADRVTRLSLRYFGVPPTGGAPAWQDRWWGRGQPPQLIAVRVDFPPGDARIWPDLMVRPGTTMNTSCTTSGSAIDCGSNL